MRRIAAGAGVGLVLAVTLAATPGPSLAPYTSNLDAEIARLRAVDVDLQAQIASLQVQVAALGSGPSPSATSSSVPPPSSAPTPAPSASAVSAPAGTLVPATQDALRNAVAAAANGATLLLRGGTHVETAVIVTAKRLTIAAYPGEIPIITHATRRPDFLYFTGPGVVLRGITVQAGAGTYDDSQGSALVEFQEGATNGLVEDVTLIGAPGMSERQQLLYFHQNVPGGGPFTVRRTLFAGNGTDGFGVHAYPGPGPLGLVVEDSWFTDFDRSGGVTTEVPITIRRCDFLRNNIAVQLRGGASGSVITDNTGSGNTTRLQINSPVTNVTNLRNTWS